MGTHLLGGSLKSQSIRCWSKSFTLQGEAGICEFPPDSMSLCRGWVSGGIVSQSLLPVLMWIFSHSPNVWIQLASGVLSEAIVPYVAIDLMWLWEELSLGACCGAILIWGLPK